ncbi:hypothetical protein V1506DRAFT_509737 [Lipomyces tetrasporus]
MSLNGDTPFTEDEKSQMASFFEWAVVQSDKWDPSNVSSLSNAEEFDSTTLEAYCQRYLPGMGGWLANKMTGGLLGVNASEVNALFIIDYFRSGTGLPNLASDQKDGGQYIRNRKGMAGLLMTYNFSLCIACELPKEAIKLSHPVSNITQSPSSNCVVSCDASTSNFAFRAKKVIVLVPTPLYAHIAFSPSLPVAKSAAATSSFLGYTSKSIVVYDSPWWHTCIEQDGQFSMICLMVGYAGREWSKTMFGAKGGDVPEPRKILLQDWAKEEWIWGAPCPVLDLGQLVKGGMEVIKLPFRSLHFVATETS